MASCPPRWDFPFPGGARSLAISDCGREASGAALCPQTDRLGASRAGPAPSPAEPSYVGGATALSALGCLCLSSAGRPDLLQHGPQLKGSLYGSDSCLHHWYQYCHTPGTASSHLQSISIILLPCQAQCWC